MRITNGLVHYWKVASKAQGIKPYREKKDSVGLELFKAMKSGRNELRASTRVYWMTDEQYDWSLRLAGKFDELLAQMDKQRKLTEELYYANLYDKLKDK